MEDGIFDDPEQPFDGDHNTPFLIEDDLLNFETEAIGYADPQGDNKLGLSHENITNRSGIKALPTNILGHDEPVNNKANGIIGISQTPFASLNAISDHKIHSKMENWDQDVLLSNAGLPEMNPLLDLGDDTGEDDFQRMLSDWESHIDTLQTTEPNNTMVGNILNPLDDTRSVPYKMQQPSNSRETAETRNTEYYKVPTDDTYSHCPERMPSDKIEAENISSDKEMKKTDHPEKRGIWNINHESRSNEVDSNIAPMSPLSKALAIASATPVSDIADDYFDSMSQEFNTYNLSRNRKEERYGEGVPNIKNEIKQSSSPVRNYIEDYSMQLKNESSAKDSAIGADAIQNGVNSKAGNNLAGIVISSGPGGHFETFEVLEANDAENLLERFEDASHLLQNEQGGSEVQGALSEAQGRSKGPLTFSKSSQDPHRKSQLIAAVQNHFSISSSSDISSNVMDSNTEGKKPPRIVPSQRIKDALPKEIIEKIKASSQRSRTISIIEPAVNQPSQGGSSCLANTNMMKINSQSASPMNNEKHEIPINNSMRGVASYSRTSNQSPGGKSNVVTASNLNPSVWTTRFQDAATNLNRNRQYRQLGNASSPPSIAMGGKNQVNGQPASSSAVLPHQQGPNQVSLDHDYCSPANKVRRQRNISSNTINNQQLRIVGNISNTKKYTYNNEISSNTKVEVMKRLSNGVSSNNAMHVSPHIIRRKTAVTLASNSPANETTKAPIVIPSSHTTSISTSGTTIPLTIKSRPYVRVSTGNKVVTANLLKPTPLTSASMRQRNEIVSATVASTGNQSTTTTYSNISSRILQMESHTSIDASRTNATIGNKQVIEYSSISPQNSPASGNISLANASNRRDSDHKKDSGLESGEVSDDSHDGRISGNGENVEGYSKLPSYLTTINVSNCSDSRTVSAIDDTGCYDRLPAYITGVGSRANSVERIVINSAVEQKSQSIYKGKNESSGVDVNFPIMLEGPGPSPKGKKSIRHHRRNNAETESSRSRSRSPIGVATRLRGSPKLPGIADGSGKSTSTKRPRRRSRSRSRSSSSGSSYLSSRSSSAESSDSTPSPIKEAKSKRRKRSWRESNRKSSRSSPERNASKRKLPASARNKVRKHRTPSPKRNNSSRNNRVNRDENESGIVRRFTRDRQRREQEDRHNDQENSRQVEERRVVFVGKISEGTTRADIRKRFEVFGPIVEISVHFRDRGDNYGFVTFKYKVDAYEAIEHGNDDPAFPTVDICFGGRRTFCKEKYADLDSNPAGIDLSPRLNSRHFSLDDDDAIPCIKSSVIEKKAVTDFDALLQQARAGIGKQPSLSSERSRRQQK